MNNYKVVIDAGHGGDDPGATSNGVLEKDLTLQISKYMYEKFMQAGVPVTLTRSSDETVYPSERVRRILDAYGDNSNVIVISNHINSTGTPNSAEGAEVIYALRNEDTLAKNILNALQSAGQIARRVYQRRSTSNPSKDYYFIHRETGSTQPVIIEYGFINNENDLRKLQENYKKYVDAVVNAVIQTEGKPENNYTNTYVVKSGDTLWKIAQMYNTTVNELKSINNLSSDLLSIGQLLKIPTNMVSSTNDTYIVKAGDTLWSISQKYNTTVNAIKNLNNLTSNLLKIGQLLYIPSNYTTTTYTVKADDTLWKIAQMYNTTVDTIKNLNNLNNNIIYVGQVLKIS